MIPSEASRRIDMETDKNEPFSWIVVGIVVAILVLTLVIVSALF